jgi:hypothetical protein
MFRINRSLAIAMTALILFIAVQVHASAPQLVNFQGQLSTSGGSPASGTYSIKFAIYNVPSGGTALWQETQSVVVTSGSFSVLLGSVTPISDSTLGSDTAHYLGITVGVDLEMTPRTRLASVPSAMTVGSIDGASGGTIDDGAFIGVDSLTDEILDSSANKASNSAISAVAIPCSQTSKRELLTLGNKTGSKYGTLTLRNGSWTTIALHGCSGDIEAGGNLWIGYGNNDGGHGIKASLISGYSNQVLSSAAAIIGGSSNMLWNGSEGSVILGGYNNELSGDNCVVLGGSNNYQLGDNSIVWGQSNIVDAPFSMCGGDNCRTSGTWNVVAGGYNNFSSADWATVGGGGYNVANAQHATVVGGFQNGARNIAAFVGGGASNGATGAFSTVSGGFKDTAAGNSSTVAGGSLNKALGDYSFVGGGGGLGGEGNGAIGRWSTIGGGNTNVVSDSGGFIGGGQGNNVSGIYGVIAGGLNNSIEGLYAAVPGGANNHANGLCSFASGLQATAGHDRTFVWNGKSGAFGSTAAGQFLINADNVGINTQYPEKLLDVNGSFRTLSFFMPTAAFSGRVLTSDEFGNGTWQTIGSALANGWVDDGAIVRLATAGDNVGIGTATPTAKLDVAGDIRATGSLILPSAFGRIKNFDGRAILETDWTGTFGDYTAINSGYNWDLAHEPLSMVAGNFGIFFTKGSTGTPYTAQLAKIGSDGNMVIGSGPANAKLDVDGDIALRSISASLVNGANNNVSSTKSFWRITGPSAAFSVTGLANGQDGRMLILYNSTSQAMTISNESASSTAANRILTMTGANIVTVGTGTVTLIYSSTDQRWIVTSFQP